MTRIAILCALFAACIIGVQSAYAYTDVEAGEDTGVVYMTNDTATAWTSSQYAAHEASFPHWKWIWSNSQDKYVKRELTNTPWPKKACTPSNEGEVMDVYDEYYKAFITYRCFCYSEDVCGWERVDRYWAEGNWSPTPLWAAAWPYAGYGHVRDVHRLCQSIVCDKFVWSDHVYRRKRG